MTAPEILNLTAEVLDPETDDGPQVVVLYVNGEEAWRRPAPFYVDTWGDGGSTVAEAVAALLGGEATSDG